jgi:hypothetical protein
MQYNSTTKKSKCNFCSLLSYKILLVRFDRVLKIQVMRSLEQTHLNYSRSQPMLRTNEKISISHLIYFSSLKAISPMGGS